jgi:putative phosphoribosyl transferase
VAAIACQDGRPDLAWPQLGLVRPATLLIADGHDEVILGLNHRARQQVSCESDLAVIPGYARLPGEPGAQEQVARMATGWFTRHFMPATGGSPGAPTASVYRTNDRLPWLAWSYVIFL